ncbi:hypothetical protein FRC12_014686, partial [Ceratobasidium sp. 428]
LYTQLMKCAAETLEGHVTLGKCDSEGVVEFPSTEGEGPRQPSRPTLDITSQPPPDESAAAGISNSR